MAVTRLTALLVLATSVSALTEPRRLWSPQDQELGTLSSSDTKKGGDVAKEEDMGGDIHHNKEQFAFAPLPANRAPDHPNWTNSMAICTMIKKEDPEDIVEWVKYHQWRGVDKIGIVENNFTVTPDLEEALEPYISSGFVDLKAWGSDSCAQVPAFASCFHQMRETYDWVAFLDADEYLMLLDGSKNGLKGLLNEYKEHAALAVNWIMFGPGGRKERPSPGGVMRWYIHCKKTADAHIKAIANSYYLLMMDGHPHNFFYRGDRRAVNENYTKIYPPGGKRGKQCDVPDDDVTGGKQCMVLPGIDSSDLMNKPLKKIALFHYVTKSYEDFTVGRERRGFCNRVNSRGLDYFQMMEKMTDQTGGMCDVAVKAWDQCCSSGRSNGEPEKVI